MHTAEYINFFRNQTDNRVTELQEEIAGIEKRLSALYLDKENLSNESQDNANKFLLTTNHQPYPFKHYPRETEPVR